MNDPLLQVDPHVEKGGALLQVGPPGERVPECDEDEDPMDGDCVGMREVEPTMPLLPPFPELVSVVTDANRNEGFKLVTEKMEERSAGVLWLQG